MSIMAQKALAAMLPLSALALTLGMSELHASEASNIRQLPIDRPANVSGVRIACTGIGFGEQREARWKAYPVKLESVDARGQYLGDENLTLRNGSGNESISVGCNAPWIMLGLSPGHYSGAVQANNGSTTATRHIAFSVPRTGQRAVIVRFSGIDRRGAGERAG